MMFPVAVEQIRAPTATDADAGAPKISGKKTILVVEDTAEVRELVVEWLRDAGYTVAHASSGDEALPILRSGIAFDMLFTDIRMPGTFNGINLAREAEIIQPGIRILLTTGYSGSDQPSELPFDVIFKPYVPDALFSKLADVFGPQAAD